MRIEPNDILKKQITKRYWKELRRTFVLCRQSVLDKAAHVDPVNLKDYVSGLLNDEPMKKKYLDIWELVGGKFGYDTENLIKLKKSGLAEIEHKAERAKDWTERMRRYAAERSLQKLDAIMTTEQEAINIVIDNVIKRTLDEGMGIVESRKLMVESLGRDLVELEKWQAQRIALTEVGSAANTGSFLAAQENSEGVKKVWGFVPGRKTFRENHQQFEADGPKSMDFEYAPGLAYPGDPRGAAEEVINCYCTILYEV